MSLATEVEQINPDLGHGRPVVCRWGLGGSGAVWLAGTELGAYRAALYNLFDFVIHPWPVVKGAGELVSLAEAAVGRVYALQDHRYCFLWDDQPAGIHVHELSVGTEYVTEAVQLLREGTVIAACPNVSE